MPPAVRPARDRRPGLFVVYGATGHTGRMVCAELSRRSLAFALSGRDAPRLRELAASLRGCEVRPAPVDHPPSLTAALAGASAVINCAGPFLDTADAVCRAALDAGAHYVDLAAEQPAAAHCFESFAAPAREPSPGRISSSRSASRNCRLSDAFDPVAAGEWP